MLANPATGDNMIMGARRVVTFRWPSFLKEKVNREDEG